MHKHSGDTNLALSSTVFLSAEYLTHLQPSFLGGGNHSLLWPMRLTCRAQIFPPLSSYLSDIRSVPGAWPPKCRTTDATQIFRHRQLTGGLRVVLASTRRHKCVMTECLVWSRRMRGVQTQSTWALSGPPCQRGSGVRGQGPYRGWEQSQWLYEEWNYHGWAHKPVMMVWMSFMYLSVLSLYIQVRDQFVDWLVSLSLSSHFFCNIL